MSIIEENPPRTHEEIQERKSDKPSISKFKIFFIHLSSFWHIILSHHPECDKFKGHTINIGKIHLCIGCYIGYPSAIIGIFLIDALNLNQIIPHPYLLIIGIILLSTFALSLLNLTNIKIVKIIQKIAIGFGSSFIFWWIWGQNTSTQEKIFTIFIVFGLILTVLNLYHVYGFVKKCYKCSTPFLWGECGGFETITRRLEKYNLYNYFFDLKDLSNQVLERRRKKK